MIQSILNTPRKASIRALVLATFILSFVALGGVIGLALIRNADQTRQFRENERLTALGLRTNCATAKLISLNTIVRSPYESRHRFHKRVFAYQAYVETARAQHCPRTGLPRFFDTRHRLKVVHNHGRRAIVAVGPAIPPPPPSTAVPLSPRSLGHRSRPHTKPHSAPTAQQPLCVFSICVPDFPQLLP